MINRSVLRAASLLAVIVAGSCSTPEDQQKDLQDPQQNFPIAVEPAYQSLKVSAQGPLSADDGAKLAAFANAYLAHGNGAITISVPQGSDPTAAVAMLGEQLERLGIPRDRIVVGTRDATADSQIEIGYIGYEARTSPCGDWSVNAADNADNRPMPNFGCAVQHDIAAQVADPRDLEEPRAMSPADTVRRMQVLGKYEQGQTTQQQKTQDQSGAISTVGSGGQ